MKEHMGASEFRDTLLLLLPEDSKLASGDLGPLILASQRVSGTGHPAVMALYPADSKAAAPRILERGGIRLLEVRAAGDAVAVRM